MAEHKYETVKVDNDEDEEEDPVTEMIKKTGCLDQHNAVMECMADHRDWRKCQIEVKLFRECMSKTTTK